MVGAIKSNSSRWMNGEAKQSPFGWQNGFGGFSVSASTAPVICNYIAKQAEHHKKKTFKEELLELLGKNEIDFDERYLFS